MKYLSLDIETTGLDSKKDQILQLAMVVDDLSDPKPIEELPSINVFVDHPRIEGNAFALSMNSWILNILSEKTPLPEGAILSNMTQLGAGFYLDENRQIAHTNNPILNFLYTQFEGMPEKITVAGKNAAGFDIPFLPPAISTCFKHRVLDVGSLFIENGDMCLPDFETCLNRTGVIEANVCHDALRDAQDVCRCVRHKLG